MPINHTDVAEGAEFEQMNGHEEKARVQWRVCRSVEGRIHTWDVRFPGRER